MTKRKSTTDVDVVSENIDELTSACPTLDSEHWYAQAKSEHIALKTWKRDGEKGERPATPTLDDMNERYIAAGCAPGSASSKTRRTSSTPRTPAMGEVDLVRRLRELLDETPSLSQSAATATLTAEGATIRQVRAAYKAECAQRPKPAKIEKPVKAAPVKKASATKKPMSAAAKKTTIKKSTAKKTSAKSTAKTVTPNFKQATA